MNLILFSCVCAFLLFCPGFTVAVLDSFFRFCVSVCMCVCVCLSFLILFDFCAVCARVFLCVSSPSAVRSTIQRCSLSETFKNAPVRCACVCLCVSDMFDPFRFVCCMCLCVSGCVSVCVSEFAFTPCPTVCFVPGCRF